MKKIKAFSLAEMMVVMLIMTIILAASIPILSKRAKVKAAAAANVILPVKNVGDTCTTGSIAIASDGTVLTCQGGTFKKPSSGSVGQVLYLYSDTWVTTTCPNGWTNLGRGPFAKTGDNSCSYVRTCYNASQTCSTLYVYGGACPVNWSDAGSGDAVMLQNGFVSSIRSCYKCD